ncbi:hypothetical protein NMY22_g9700 [Coprinellus aureogranulatus]|nr:hypothetical protein NMY22_g9700 [Coprinellus aureogranulatus]
MPANLTRTVFAPEASYPPYWFERIDSSFSSPSSDSIREKMYGFWGERSAGCMARKAFWMKSYVDPGQKRKRTPKNLCHSTASRLTMFELYFLKPNRSYTPCRHPSLATSRTSSSAPAKASPWVPPFTTPGAFEAPKPSFARIRRSHFDSQEHLPRASGQEPRILHNAWKPLKIIEKTPWPWSREIMLSSSLVVVVVVVQGRGACDRDAWDL